jgi:hypothetical protein
VNRSLKADGVPQNDCASDQVRATGAVAFHLDAAIAHFTEALEEHPAGERVTDPAHVRSCMDMATEFDVVQPVENEEGVFDPRISPSATARPFCRG